ncbi:MAG TPA: hypothetical protein VFM82_10825 [Flavobacteriaceae bacterium]|nr:hypothetical protein [Flavobacteriaceae bacterium]
MKKQMTFLAAFFVLALASAQEKTPTVEEIYAKYIEAIGGKEKVKSITTKQEMKITSTEGRSGNTVINTQNGRIEFLDYVEEKSASITRTTSSTGTDTYSRSLIMDGKGYLLLKDGTRMDYPVHFDMFKWGIFQETMQPGSQTMPDEVFNGEEVYVVKYELEKSVPSIKTNEYYEYFSKTSGLRIGAKQISSSITENKTLGNTTVNTTTIFEFKDYKEVGGILIPHQTTMDYENVMSGGLNRTSSSSTTMTIKNIQLNVDMEDFRQNCFQQPEACFAKFTEN